MSGHSKWSKVKTFKGAIDAKRGKLFSKLAREVTIAARDGGGDPGMNARLRMVLLKCRSANMPADNIERAILKGTGGGDGPALEELTYEIFAPHGVALLVELTTDNRNRTAAEIRRILTKNGGSMATSGAVTRLFQRRGQIIVTREDANEDSLMEIALEAGAEDFSADKLGYEILTDPPQFEDVLKAVETAGIKTVSATVTFLPSLTVPITDPDEVNTVKKLTELIEDHDDVQDVYSNADLPEDTE